MVLFGDNTDDQELPGAPGNGRNNTGLDKKILDTKVPRPAVPGPPTAESELPGAPSYGKGKGTFGIEPNSTNRLLGLGGDVSDQIKDYLSGVLSGKDVPFGQGQVDALTANLKQQTQGSAAAATDAATQQAIARGLGRSPSSLRQLTSIQNQAASSFTQGQTNIEIERVKTNFAARMSALDRAQKWLDDYRSYAAQLDANDANRQQAIASISLGYARLDAERESLKAKFQHDFDVIQANKIPVNIGGQTIYVPPELIPSLMGSMGG